VEIASVRPLRIAEAVPSAETTGPDTMAADELATAGLGSEPADFQSPFEDELDVPAFLRKAGSERGRSQDLEVPTYRRRSAD
jgi:hypothetical protein